MIKIFFEDIHLICLKDKYSKTCLKQPLKNRQNKDQNDNWQLHEGWR